MSSLKALAQKIFMFFLSKEEREVMKTLTDYADAFMTFEPVNVLGYLDQPLTFVSDSDPEVIAAGGPTSTTHIYSNEEEITAFLQAYMDDMVAKHYAKDKLSGFKLQRLTKEVIVTSFNLIRINSSGEPFCDMGAAYTWRKSDGNWKCTVGILLSHEKAPKNPYK